MDTDEPKFVQAAPNVLKAGGVSGEREEKLVENKPTARSGWGRQLRGDELDDDADQFLTWITRYPVERNHPRPTTGSTPVKKSGDAVVCLTTDKVSDVLQKLVVEGFLSLPVLSAGDQRLVGYIDMLDLVWYTLWSFGVWNKEMSREDVVESKENFSTFLSLERFRNAVVMDVLGRPAFGTRNQPHHVFKGFSLFHVFESMARLSAHRLAICNSERKVVGLITQSMVISLFDQHLDQLGSLATNHTVAEMIPGLFEELRLVKDTDLALVAFKDMVKFNVSGIAVVDAAGVLIDTISIRDLRGIGSAAEDWTALWMQVKEFKQHCRTKFPSQTPATPIYVLKTNSLHDIIKKMDDGNIHRLWCCEERNGKPTPTHCISQRDVFRFLLHLSGLKSTALEDLERAAEVM